MINDEMKDILKALDSHKPKTDIKFCGNNEKDTLNRIMGYKVLKPYSLESIYHNADKNSNQETNFQMYSF